MSVLPPSPPPLPSSPVEAKRRFYSKLAWVPLLSLGVSFLCHLLLQPAKVELEQQSADMRAIVRIVEHGVPMVALFVSLGSGIWALTRVPVYGRKGILWPALSGLALYGLLMLAAIPAVFHAGRMARPIQLAPVTPDFAGITIRDPQGGWAVDVPRDFQPAEKAPEYSHLFTKRVPGETNQMVAVKSLGQPLPRRWRKEDVAPEYRPLRTSYMWRGLEVDGMEVLDDSMGDPQTIFTAQIPLQGEAIQIEVVGPTERKAEMRARMQKLLASLAGETNWTEGSKLQPRQ